MTTADALDLKVAELRAGLELLDLVDRGFADQCRLLILAGLERTLSDLAELVERERIRRAPANPPSFVCPLCGGRTFRPADVENRYCPCCGSPPLLPKRCPHQPPQASAQATGNRN